MWIYMMKVLFYQSVVLITILKICLIVSQKFSPVTIWQTPALIQLGPQMNDLTHISQLLKIFSSEAANSLVEDSLSYGLSYAASGLRYANSKNEKLQNVFLSIWSVKKKLK